MPSVPGFRLQTLLHEGQFTWVYRALELATQRAVVVKILQPEKVNSETLAQFQREFKLLQRFKHPNIVSVSELKQLGGYWLMVFDDAQAESVERLLLRGVQFSDQATFTQLALQLSAGLAAIHAANLIHKTINPANLVWNPERRELQIIDFGACTELGQASSAMESERLWDDDLRYIAPEQTGRMNRVLDQRSDFYAMGATLYHLLSGLPLFSETDALALIHSHMTKQPDWSVPSLRQQPAMLRAILSKLLHKDPDLRYQRVEAIQKDLLALQNLLECDQALLMATPGCAEFKMPKCLYGRDGEVAEMLQRYERAAGGACAMLLVAGEPGIGKTALVREVYRPLSARHAFFAQGKCDQYRRSTPYESLLLALRELIAQVSSSPTSQRQAWIAALRRAVGRNAALATEILPELAAFVEVEDAAMDVPATEARNRLSQLLQNIVQTFASAEHPLVLFLDDLHWADTPTLRLLEVLLLSPDHHHMLIVGAYRSNELGPEHALTRLQQKLAMAERPLLTLYPRALSQAQLVALLRDAMQSPGLECAALAEIALAKTQGNPFFLLQWLHLLLDQELLSFDYRQGCWVWDEAELLQLDVADNVVELMVQRVRQFPPATVDLLQLAASLGHEFELSQLALVAGLLPQVALELLMPCVEEGLLLPTEHTHAPDVLYAEQKDSRFKFSHDRVQQACYALVESTERARVHYRIGRELLHASVAEPTDDQLFAMVEHLGKGIAFIESESERLQMVRLSLQAAQKKRLAGAYKTAARDLEQAARLLGAQAWSMHYRHMFDLATAAAEVAYLAGDYEQAQAIFEEILQHAQDDRDIVACLTLQMQSLQLQGRNVEAITVQRQGLARLNIEVPETEAALQRELDQGIAQLEAAAARGDIERMLSGADMQDTRIQASIPLLFGLWFASYVAGQPVLCTLAAVRMSQLSLRFGVTDCTPMALANFALVEVVLREDYALAGTIGQMAVDLAEKRPNLVSRANTKGMYAGLLAHWHFPMAVAIRHYDEAYKIALECGDYVIAGNIIPMRGADQIVQGHYLPEILESTEHLLARHQAQGQFDLADLTIAGVLMPIRCLMGIVDAPQCYDYGEFSEAAFLRQYADAPLVLAYYWHGKIRNAYLFDCDDAESIAMQQGLVEQVILGQCKGPEAAFYAAMIWARSLQRDPRRADAPQLRQRFEALRVKQVGWAQLCPDNYAAKAWLLEAERARSEGDMKLTLHAYREAIECATRYGQMHLQALASERFALYWQGMDQPQLARALLQDAVKAYRQWGASAKVERLLAAHPWCFSIQQGDGLSSPLAAYSHTSAELDLETIVSASEELSRAVGLRQVLDCLLTIVRNAAGAEVARLLLPSGGSWYVEAEIALDRRRLLQHEWVNLEDDAHPLLPLSLLRYVANSRESVIEPHLSQSHRFAQDPYVLHHQPHSAMCLPLQQSGHLRGLMYLENNQAKGMFSDERHRFMLTLAGQLLIAINNAYLHDELEGLVAQRTRDLEEANRKLAELCRLDGLTSIPNRRSFNEVIEKESQRAKREQLPWALMLIDVDHFKEYNDYYGHLEGDSCLVKIAQALTAGLKRPGDYVARYGGEEFAVILPGVDLPQAQFLAESLRQKVADLRIPHQGGRSACNISISIGVAHIPVGMELPLSSIINTADQALYLAKAQGRNCVVHCAVT